MGLLIIIPVIIAGFTVFIHHPRYFYKLHRYEGQLLYLKSAYLGIICTIWGFFVTFTVTNFIPDNLKLIEYFLKNININNVQGVSFHFLISLIINTFLVSITWSIFAKQWGILKAAGRMSKTEGGKKNEARTKKQQVDDGELTVEQRYKITLMSTILQDSPLDELFLTSYIEGELLMFTMEDRKIYVGRVLNLGEPNESQGLDQEIKILPAYSGYRDENTLSVELKTFYKEKDEISLVLRQDRIISATEFNYDVFMEYQKDKDQKMFWFF